MKTVCLCYAKDYDLARATARPGDIFLFDANSGDVPSGDDVLATHFRRPCNIVGKECIRGLWEAYLAIMDAHGVDRLLSRPADTRILRPDLWDRPADLVGVGRTIGKTWRQWGCGQAWTRSGVELALDRLAGDPCSNCGWRPGVIQEDLAASWIMRDRAFTHSGIRACFWFYGQRPHVETAFVNFDNFDPAHRPRDVRGPLVLDSALRFRATLASGAA